LDFGRPREPTDNAVIKAFNGRFEAECLDAHWFLALADADADADAAKNLDGWSRDYNQVRSLGAIDNKTPIALMDPGDGASPPP
jgi:putative transposase